MCLQWQLKRPIVVRCQRSCGAVLAMSGSPTSRQFYYVESCPAMNACSRTSWKNAAVWGWSQAECKSQLSKHLTVSGKHQSMKASDRKLLVEGADLVEEVHTFEKRPRLEEGAGSSDGQQQLAIGRGPPCYMEDEMAELNELELAQQALDQESHCGGVILRQVEFDSMIDSVSRAATCARSAQRLAASAAKAFSDEVASLEAVRAHLQNIKESAEVEMRG